MKIANLVTGLGLALLGPTLANGDEGSDVADSAGILREAEAILIKADEQFISKLAIDELLAQHAILESQTDLPMALERACAIKNPFYSSLALGGIAASEIAADPTLSAAYLREAFAQAKEIDVYNDSHATSLGFLFELPPFYPEKEARELLKQAREIFDSWEASDVQKSKALLSLARSTTKVSPENARALLYDVALKSNHYFSSIEYLATFMAQKNLAEAVELSETHYTKHLDWPNDHTFRRAVLIELSKSDFPSAFAGIKKMNGLDQEISTARFAEFLLENGRKKEAKQVIDHLDALNSEVNFTKASLQRLRKSLANGSPDAPDNKRYGSKAIDDFSKNPSANTLANISGAQTIVFRDKDQVRAFITAATPLLDDIRDQGYPHHGSPSSMATGLLMLSSALIQKVPEAIKLSHRIKISELRAKYLLDAYELANPMPEALDNWPIHYWHQIQVQIETPEK